MKFSEKVQLFIDELEAHTVDLVEGVSIGVVRERWLPILRQLEADLAGFEKDNANLHGENEALREYALGLMANSYHGMSKEERKLILESELIALLEEQDDGTE